MKQLDLLHVLIDASNFIKIPVIKVWSDGKNHGRNIARNQANLFERSHREVPGLKLSSLYEICAGN